ncbi:PREDICTED: nephrocystin-3 [Tarenaya hassleriana]|uniref:nephrocystin-3 n=1 Tax=Tarenaya hassleriana TaxID=28532 RepID=UPI00053C52E7|nr:PREDICTED: nephrocystin-3 [Tarenaya hassleriana]
MASCISLLPRTTLLSSWTNQICCPSSLFQRDFLWPCVCFRSRKWKSKLYPVPARQFVSGPFGSETSSKELKNCATFGLSEVQRSDLLVDTSSNNSFNGMEDFENELQELFNEIKTMVKMGNVKDAVDLLQANYLAVKEQMNAGLKGIEQAALLDVIALGYMAVGDLKLVRPLLDMIDRIVDGLKDDEPLLDSVLVHLGSMYSVVGKFENAILVHQRVVGILEGRYGKGSTLLVTPLLGLAKSLGSAGKANKGIDVYKRAITVLESNRGANSEDLVIPLFALGKLLLKEKRATDAEIPFTRILNIYTKKYGEKDGRVGMAMCSLANAKCARGAAEDAIDLYRNALQIIKDSNYMAIDDSILESMRTDLAELLHLVGRGNEGRELLEECLLITEKYKGKNHPSMAKHLLNLATSYSQSKNFVEAERLLRTCLDIMEKSVGPEDQSITFPMLHLAVTLSQLNRDEEAESLALKVLQLRENTFGKDSLPVGEALDCLVSIRARLGRDDRELLELVKRVMMIQEKEFGSEAEELIVTLQKIVYFLDKLRMKDEKFKFRRRIALLREKYRESIP